MILSTARYPGHSKQCKLLQNHHMFLSLSTLWKLSSLQALNGGEETKSPYLLINSSKI